MSRIRRGAMALAVLLALVLGGCGSKEVVMKEFISEDETVSISMDENWRVEDMGAGTEGWLAAFNDDDSEGIIVMQAAKGLYGANVADMDAWKELIESSYPMSEMEEIEAPAVSGMNVSDAYKCEVTAEGVKGAGRVLYGETDYAYYCILYAAPRINSSGEAYFKNVCATFKETVPEIENASTVESTDTIQWFNNTCAVLTAINGCDYTMFGGLPANDESLATIQALLTEWWDVTDSQSADETLEWLLTEGHRVSFADDMVYLTEVGVADVAPEERVNYLLENFDVDEAEAQNYAYDLEIYEQFGEDAIAGWDYSRAMSLLGYYYLAGYYTEQEALDTSLEVANLIQDTFDSWDDFMESYFVGYEYWAGEDSSERREVYEELKAAADSPYSIDWNLTLEKSW